MQGRVCICTSVQDMRASYSRWISGQDQNKGWRATFISSRKGDSSGEQDEATLGRSQTNKGRELFKTSEGGRREGLAFYQAKAGRGITVMTKEDGEGFRGGMWPCA